MAGPSAAVLLPEPWADADVAPLHAWLAEALTHETDGWWQLREPAHLGWRIDSPDTGPILVEPVAWEGDPRRSLYSMVLRS